MNLKPNLNLTNHPAVRITDRDTLTVEFKQGPREIVARVHMTMEEVDDLIRVLLKWRSEHVSVTESAS